MALLGLTGWELVKRPMLGFLGAAFFLILAPTSSFIPIRDAAFEYRMYLPLAAVLVLVVLGVWELCGRIWPAPRGRAGQAPAARWLAPLTLLVAATIVLGAATVDRNEDYRSELAIWTDAVQKRPNSALNQLNLSKMLYERKQLDEAIDHCRRAIALNPRFPEARLIYGVMLMDDPRQTDRPRQLDAAIASIREALTIRPELAEAWFYLGNALESRGDIGGAVAAWREANRLKPDVPGILNHLAWALSTDPDPSVRDGPAAVVFAQRAVEIGGMDPRRLLQSLAAAYAEAGRFDEAVQTAKRALQMTSELKRDAFTDALRDALEQQLRLYQAGSPYHSPARSN